MDRLAQYLSQLKDSGEWKVSIWRAFGYTLNRSWICVMFFNSVLFTVVDEGHRWSVINEVYLSSILSLALALALGGLMYRPVMKLFDTKLGEFVGPLIAGLGLVVLAPSLIEGTRPDFLILLGSAIGTGCGSALVLLDVGRSYALASGKICALEVLGATVLAALISLVVFFTPLPFAIFIVITMPFLSVLCVKKSFSIQYTLKEHRISQGEHLSGKMLSKFILCAFVLGAVTGFMRDMYSFHSKDVFGFEYTAFFSAGALVAALLMIVIIISSKQFSIETLYKPVVLLCTVGFAIIPALGSNTQLPFLVVTIGYTLFEVLVWVILSEVANRFQYTSIQVFGIGRAIVLVVGVIMGSLFAQSLSNINSMDIQTLVIISAIAVSLITFSRNYILTGRDLESFEGNQAPVSSQVETPTQQKKVPLLRRCQIIGEHYSLSNREIDVFHLLASGRNAARVQEELMISAGTVNTHTRHIYQKLDVHTQQELIDLMQNADLDTMEKR